MKKIVFFNVPAHGHINPTIPIVKELLAQGNEIYYFIDEKFKDLLDFPGLHFRPVNFDLVNSLLQKTQDNILEMMPVAIQTSDDILTNHLDEIKKINPDLIIYDNTCIWGRDIADILHKPSIGSFSIFVMDTKILKELKNFSMFSMSKMIFSGSLFKQAGSLIKFKKLYSRYLKKHGVAKRKFTDFITNEAPQNLVYTTKDIQPGAELLDGRYQFIGPVIREDSTGAAGYGKKLDPLKKTVFISLGTAKHNSMEFLQLCIDAADKMNLNAIVACGKHAAKEDFKSTNPNVIIEPFVPQMAVLPLCDAFITHGGMNSTHEGLYFEKPMLFAPRQDEQRLVALQVVKQGAGILLDEQNLDLDKLCASIEEALHNPEYKNNARRLSENFKKAGGAKRGVQIILDYLKVP